MALLRKKRTENSRVDLVYSQIRELAFKRGPEAKLPTLAELQNAYGASQATVSGALDELEAENVIFRKDRSGIFVSPRLHQKMVLVLLESSFFRHRGDS